MSGKPNACQNDNKWLAITCRKVSNAIPDHGEAFTRKPPAENTIRIGRDLATAAARRTASRQAEAVENSPTPDAQWIETRIGDQHGGQNVPLWCRTQR